VSNTPTQFNFNSEQIEGVAQIINMGSAVSRVALTNSVGQFGKLFPINPGQVEYVAFGTVATHAVIFGEEIVISPGYVQKNVVPIFDMLQYQPSSWYDPTDLRTLFQNTALTTPVTANNDPVGAVKDKSGNNRHLLQATAAARPLFKQAGFKWLEADGVNDVLTANVIINQPLTRISAWRILTDAFGIPIGGAVEGNTENGATALWFTADDLRLYAGVGTVAAGAIAANVDFVLTEIFNGANSTIFIDNTQGATGDPGSNGHIALSIFARSDAGAAVQPMNARCYGLVEFPRVLQRTEILPIVSNYAKIQGRNL
jgi:hypothetical protein